MPVDERPMMVKAPSLLSSPLAVARTFWNLGLLSIGRVILYRLLLVSGYWRRRMPVFAFNATVFWRHPSSEDDVCHVVGEKSRAAARDMTQRILNGEVLLFGRWVKRRATLPQWLEDPISGRTWPDARKHWSDIDHFGGGFDIKSIWDCARFGWAPVLAAGASSVGPRSVDLLNEWMRSFLENNPCNQGPLWSCGQETAIRSLNIILATCILEQDRTPCPALVDLLVAHGRRIKPTIFYAVGQRNNHAISESAGLFAIGLWLALIAPVDSIQRKLGMEWREFGRGLLEKTVQLQIADDGGHSQRSLGYHRAVLDTLSVVEILRRRWGEDSFSTGFYSRAAAAAEFLFQFVEPDGGKVPALGPKDGSGGFDLAFLGIDDYRPSVQLAMGLFRGTVPYDSGPWDGALELFSVPFRREPRGRQSILFPDSGYVTMVVGEIWGVLVAPRYRIRASHADGLHLDIWRKQDNLFFDSGTCSYYLDDLESSRMFGVWGHNTISFDDDDQMVRVSRFLYVNWPRQVSLGFVPSANGVAVEASMVDWRGRRHSRRVEASAEVLSICDTAVGPARRARIRWFLGTAGWSTATTACWQSRQAGLSVIASGSRSSTFLGQAVVSMGYGKTATMPVVMGETSVPAAFITRLELKNQSEQVIAG